jgi:hypothetical protein
MMIKPKPLQNDPVPLPPLEELRDQYVNGDDQEKAVADMWLALHELAAGPLVGVPVVCPATAEIPAVLNR